MNIYTALSKMVQVIHTSDLYISYNSYLAFGKQKRLSNDIPCQSKYLDFSVLVDIETCP